MIVPKVIKVDPKNWERKKDEEPKHRKQLTQEQLKGRIIDLENLIK